MDRLELLESLSRGMSAKLDICITEVRSIRQHQDEVITPARERLDKVEARQRWIAMTLILILAVGAVGAAQVGGVLKWIT